MKTRPLGAEPRRFLKSLRRRYLTLAFLAFCLPAALLNEAYRWTAYSSGQFFGIDIPYLNTGPYFLLAAFVLTLRRWSLPRTASFADQRLSFRDRLASFIDFSNRDDLPPHMRRAQASEVTRRLGTVAAGTLVPLRLRHLLGPILLAVSLMYPLIFFSSSNPPPFSDRSDNRSPVGRAENAPDMPASRLDGEPDGTGPPEHVAAGDSVADNNSDPRGNAGGLEVVDSQRDGSSSKPADQEPSNPPGRSLDNPFEREGNELENIASKRTGLKLSDVVDPVFAASTDGQDQDTVIPGGSMSFRLIPKTAPGDEKVLSSAAAVAPSVRIDVDFESIPERYRKIVQRYFTDLERITAKGSI